MYGHFVVYIRGNAFLLGGIVLASREILTLVQLFAGTGSSESWLQHARGVGVLMEQRGPNAHRAEWDAAMLLSFRGILVSCSPVELMSVEC